MKPEDKQLLLADLCARLPYGIISAVSHYDEDGEEALLQGKITGFNKWQIKFEYLPDCTDDIGAYNWFDIDLVKPYLRPMSSMTEEEKKEFIEYAGYEIEESVNGRHYEYYLKDFCGTPDNPSVNTNGVDWLNKKMFDFRGLIPKGLALSTEIYNPYKN